jgi:ribosome-binding factor A
MPKRQAQAGPTQRQRRVAEEVRHALAAIFQRADFRDPALSGLHLTVTEVRASPDLRHMIAFISALGRDPTAEELAALRRASGYLRTSLARAVHLRAVPELHFEPDTALGYAMRINQAMQDPRVQHDIAAGDDAEKPA